MFRCPKCHVELPADAKFCKSCGFNQTNAKIMALKEQGGPAQPPQPPARPVPNVAPSQPGQGAPGSVQPMRGPQGNPPQPQKASSLMSYAASPNPPQVPTPQSPALPPGMPPQGRNNQPPPPRPPEQIVRSSTPPNPNQPVQYNRPPMPVQASPARPGNPISAPREGLWDGLTLDDLYNDPSMMATGQAAEHWRESWRMRQKAEAGPAVGIARGQAAVPEPLLAMQHSIARMRAVLKTNTKPDIDRSKGSAFWIPVILMSCVILGLLAYTVTSFSGSSATASIAAPSIHPNLMVDKTLTTTYTAGGIIATSGDNFSPNSAVTLSLDSQTTPGHTQDVESDKHGNIATTVTVPPDAVAGTYFLKAVDDQTKVAVTFPVHVLPTNLANTAAIQSSANQLAFTASPANPEPKSQAITLKNSTGTDITWSSATFSDYTQIDPNMPPIGSETINWLLVDQAGGQLAPQGTLSLAISVNAMSLPASVLTTKGLQPYVGYVIINTVDEQNHQGQMIVKVTLVVNPNTDEVAITPATTLAVNRNPDGSCVSTSITLTDLGSAITAYSVQAADGLTANTFTFVQTRAANFFRQIH